MLRCNSELPSLRPMETTKIRYDSELFHFARNASHWNPLRIWLQGIPMDLERLSILTLVIYSECRSLIKFVSDAAKLMSQSCLCLYFVPLINSSFGIIQLTFAVIKSPLRFDARAVCRLSA